MLFRSERLVRVLNGEGGSAVLPDQGALEAFGQALRRRLPRGSVRILPSEGRIGGGSSPDEAFPSSALQVEAKTLEAAGGATKAAARLRSGEPPLIAVIRDGTLLVDLAALQGEDPALVAGLLRAALFPTPSPPDTAAGD